MSTRQLRSHVELFLARPVKSSLLTFGPLALALGQLTNSYLNGISPLVAIGFAAIMLGFAVIATSHHAAEYRLGKLETEFGQFR